MDKLFVSHGGLSSLCFDRNAFFQESFNVDSFLASHTQRGITLEVLKDDLATYRKILQSALVQLIDREYADFVHLSSSLVGLDKGIEKLKVPVEDQLSSLQDCLLNISSYVSTLNSKLQRRRAIESEKKSLTSLTTVMSCMEKLVRLDRSLSDAPSNQSRLPMLYRISDLLSRISRERVMVENTSWYFAAQEQLNLIYQSFDKTLAADMLDAFRSADVKACHIYCTIYRHLERVPRAREIVMSSLILPIISSVVRENGSNKSSFSVLLDDLLAVVEGKFYFLVYFTDVDFVMESLWTCLVSLLCEDSMNVHYVPDRAEVFRENYLAAKSFLDRFVHLFGSTQKDFSQVFWRHPATKTFMEKWSLPVYYQVRFLEIATPVENEFRTPVQRLDTTVKVGFRLRMTVIVWNAIERCWSEEVCLPELVHRFWKLTCLILSRYHVWLKQLDTRQGDLIPDILADLSNLRTRCETLPADYVKRFLGTDEKRISVVSTVMNESIADSLKPLNVVQRELLDRLAVMAAEQAMDVVKAVQEIPRMYRHTNRDIPTVHSAYVDEAFAVVTAKLSSIRELDSEQLQSAINVATSQVAKRFCNLAFDLLDAVRRMEGSLKKLRKTRAAGAENTGGLSDDDKIRLQVALDTEQMISWIQRLNVSGDILKELSEVKRRTVSDKQEQES